ncbi:YbdD/YjiX family protein [Microbacterium sp.]|uniref:YbdD/YjiX family protein n=1 Tax=Microbacterium sp. TaxID=51671 RepID=UPI002810CA4E|nr:YbdD/YjiX family protein [Microbacterium sp.]
MTVSELNARSAPAAAWRRVRSAAAKIRWYVTTLMGDRAYDVYVAHVRSQHPDAPIPTERQFWCDRMAEQDRNPGARCC